MSEQTSTLTPPSTPPRLIAQDFSSFNPSPSQPLSPILQEPDDEVMDRLNLLDLHDKEERDDALLELRHPRPYTPRSASDTMPSPLLQPSQPQRPRNRSPYSRPHLRSQSSTGSLSAPPMTRAHSSPAFTSTQFILPPAARSSSPLRSPKRVRSPFRAASDEFYQGSSAISDIESIDEDHELDITPRPAEYRIPTAFMSSDPGPLQLYHNNTFPRRRRPASPLHQVSSSTFIQPTSAPASVTHSPLFTATKFTESFPGDLTYSRSFSSVSSMPSTPTSARSRSPSISSLETIPDTPDAEIEAIEAEKLENLRRAAENGSDSFRRSSLDGGRGAAGFGTRDKRKRWSVCGAEKRSDLNLETIWED